MRGGGCRRNVTLGDHGRRLPPLGGCRHVNVELARRLVELKARHYGAPARVRGDAHGFGPSREGAAGTIVGQQEDHGGGGYRFVVLVLNLDDRLTRRALLDVVNGPVALYNDEVQSSGGGWLGRLGPEDDTELKRQRQKDPKHGWLFHPIDLNRRM